MLARSSLHLSLDIFAILASDDIALFFDERTYPISRWGLRMSRTRPSRIKVFRHQDMQHLADQIRQYGKNRRCVIVTDGLCPHCGKIAPLNEILSLLERIPGVVVLDDTQAIGLLGLSPARDLPFGQGGGGSMRWHGINDSRVLYFASLSKGFGVPIAVFAGNETQTAGFVAGSQTMVHCSPHTQAELSAVELALNENEMTGDDRRRALFENVRYFRDVISRRGLKTTGGIFPVQSIYLPKGYSAEKTYEKLSRLGMQTVLQQSRHNTHSTLTVIVRSDHQQEEIEEAAFLLHKAIFN